MARSLNPIVDGSNPRTMGTTGKLQVLQQIAVSSAEDGKKNPAEGSPIYVGITPHPSDRVEESKEKSDQKEQKEVLKNDRGISKGEKESLAKGRKISLGRRIEDGLLLVVSTKIYGHTVKALIDSGATRCFVTPACVTTCGLKAKPRDVFLELGNGVKFLSRGFIPDVPVVTAGLTVKIGLTVTNLLHEVDLVLGMTWLQLVNPVVDWGSGKLYVPNSVQTALLQGSWLEGHVQAGTVTVLSTEEELSKLKNEEKATSISVIKTPKFWQLCDKSRATYSKGGEKQKQWTSMRAEMYENNCKSNQICNTDCKKNDYCKLFVIRTDEGVVKVKRLNNNARIPVKGTPEAAGYDLAAAQTAVCPAHGKVLVKTGLSLAMPSGCYGRIAPRSGLALKKFIDVGAGVVDADYRGELGIVLFNFSDTDFQINMGDKVAQLIFEKIKTPVLKEVDSLEDTDRGNKGFGSTGIKTTSESESVQSVTKISDNQAVQDSRISKISMNEPIPHIKRRSQTAKARRISCLPAKCRN